MCIYRLLPVVLMMMFLSACTANLKVKKGNTNGSESEVHGIPFRVPTPYVFSGKYTKHSKFGENCTHTPFYEVLALPLGDLYYANVKTGELAGSEFTIEFTEQGTLKKISLNSDTTVDDVASGVASLVGAALPFLSPVPTPPAALDSEEGEKFQDNGTPPSPLPSCDTGKVVHCVETFEAFMERKKIDGGNNKCLSEQDT